MKKKIRLMAGALLMAVSTGVALPLPGVNTTASAAVSGCSATVNYPVKVREKKTTESGSKGTLSVGTIVPSDCGGTKGGEYTACGVERGKIWLRVYSEYGNGYVASACVTYNN